MVHEPGEDASNGAEEMAKLIRTLPDVEWVVVSNTEVCMCKVVCDLRVAFGPKAMRELSQEKTKFKDARRMLMPDKTGVPFTTTYNSKSIYGAPQFIKIILEDIAWAVYRMVTPFEEYTMSLLPPDYPTGATGFKHAQSLDIETTHFRYWDKAQRVLTVALALSNGKYLGHWGVEREMIQRLIGDPNAELAGHNIKFDMNFLRARGYDWRAKVWDTSVAAALLDDNITDCSLGWLGSRFTDMPYHKDMVDRTNLVNEDPDQVMRYNILDSVVGAKVAEQQKIDIRNQEFGPLMEFLMDMMPVFSKMEVRGVNICKRTAFEVGTEVRLRRDKALQEFGYAINLNSPQQLRKVLFEDLKLVPVSFSDKSGDPSTKRGDIETILDRIETGELLPPDETAAARLRGLLDYRRFDKLDGTYLRPLPEFTAYDGRIHASWNLSVGEFGGARTGRTSCRGPNLQNIPNPLPGIPNLREMFVASNGFRWGDTDYAGLEMRIIADLAGEQSLIEMFEQGWDIHSAMMARLRGQEYEEIARILDNKDHPDYIQTKINRVMTKTSCSPNFFCKAWL